MSDHPFCTHSDYEMNCFFCFVCVMLYKLHVLLCSMLYRRPFGLSSFLFLTVNGNSILVNQLTEFPILYYITYLYNPFHIVFSPFYSYFGMSTVHCNKVSLPASTTMLLPSPLTTQLTLTSSPGWQGTEGWPRHHHSQRQRNSCRNPWRASRTSWWVGPLFSPTWRWDEDIVLLRWRLSLYVTKKA